MKTVRTIKELHQPRTIVLWVTTALLSAVLVIIDFTLIYSLSRYLEGDASGRTVGSLLTARLLTALASIVCTSALISRSRAEVQLRLWLVSVDERNFAALSSFPSLHQRVLSQAPTDVAAGLVAPSAGLAGDSLALFLLMMGAVVFGASTVGGATNILVLVLGLALLLAVSVALTARSSVLARSEAFALESSHHHSWDLSNGMRDILINGGGTLVRDKSHTLASNLRDTTRGINVLTLTQRQIFESGALAILVVVGLGGADSQVAFVAVAVLLRFIPLVSRLGANGIAILNAWSRVRPWDNILCPRPDQLRMNSWQPERPPPDLVLVKLPHQDRLRGVVDFALGSGEWIQLAGPSGVGKSSVLDAVAGIWQSFVGRVESPPPEWIGYASQAPYIFRGTLISNVTLGRPLREGMLARLSEVLGLEDSFGKDWTAFELSDRGANISGGQRQRISLARSLAAEPHLLLFDEATVNIDPQDERRILLGIRDAFPDMSAILVSHRDIVVPGTMIRKIDL